MKPCSHQSSTESKSARLPEVLRVLEVLFREAERTSLVDELLEFVDSSPNGVGGVRVMAKLLLSHSSAAVRNEAIECLEEVKNRKDYGAILNLRFDSVWKVRATAYGALPSFGLKRAAGDLLPGFEDRDPVVRRYAYYAYWRSVGSAGMQRFERALAKERDPLALSAIYFALAECGYADMLPKLKELADMEDPHVSSPARNLLSELNRH